MAGEFTRGVQAAQEEGIRGEAGIFAAILSGVAKAKTQRDKEDRGFLTLLKELKVKEESEIRIGKAKSEETRKTEELKAKLRAKPEPKTKPLTLSDITKLETPVVPGPGGRLITGQKPEGEVTTPRGIFESIGLRPKGTLGGELVGEPETRVSKAQAFKPFQLDPQRETEFKQSVQNGLSALQGGTVNPATGNPFTQEDIFRALSAEFPGQASRLRTIFLSRTGGTQISAEDVIFAE